MYQDPRQASQQGGNSVQLPIHVLRETLRASAMERTARLSRSVARRTSYDAMPCTEYGAEVAAQRRAMEDVLYVQRCRDALEQCISRGRARLRYRWADGTRTETCFRRTEPGRVKATGLDRKYMDVPGNGG